MILIIKNVIIFYKINFSIYCIDYDFVIFIIFYHNRYFFTKFLKFRFEFKHVEFEIILNFFDHVNFDVFEIIVDFVRCINFEIFNVKSVNNNHVFFKIHLMRFVCCLIFF